MAFFNADMTPANGSQGSSSIYREGTSVQGSKAVSSQRTRVLAAGRGSNQMLRVGLVSSFGFSESKSFEAARGIGYGDQVGELVPGVTEPVEISLSRLLLETSNIMQALGYASGLDGPARSLKHLRWPFDIENDVVLSEQSDYQLTGSVGEAAVGEGFLGGTKEAIYPEVNNPSTANVGSYAHTVLLTYFETCYLTSNARTFEAEGAQISEDADAICTDFHAGQAIGEFSQTGNSPYQDGERGSIRFADLQERANVQQIRE
jgi:hypothetical protein